MQELTKRLANLPPEKRALLARMLQTTTLQEPARGSAPSDEGRISDEVLEVVDWGEGWSPRQAAAPQQLDDPANRENKVRLRRLYNAVSGALDSGMFGQYALFLNYGYRADASPSYAKVDLPEHFLNRNCVRLVLELIANCDLTDRAVLDVGCGRGGTISVLDTFFQPSALVGIDLSSRAIAFCHRNHLTRLTFYLEGDAEHIPFTAATFDVVTNVESSHNYPDIGSFYREVHRVLKPDGYFLYTDLIRRSVLNRNLALLADLGFRLELDRDITNNVLLSCDEIAVERQQVFGETHDEKTVRVILGVPGSEPYDDMRSGKSTYRIFRLRRG